METLAGFDTLDINMISFWLEHRLRGFYDTDPRARHKALDFSHFGIYRSDCESSSDALCKLFQKFPKETQDKFQKAICLLLCTAKENSFPVDSMKDLIQLACALSVRSAAPLLEFVIMRGVWGNKHRSLQYDCTSVMLSFGINTKALRKEFGFI